MKNFALKSPADFLPRTLIWAALALPVGQSENWKIVDYGKIPIHKVSFDDKAMEIQVKNSAAPIVYPFEKVHHVTAIEVSAHVRGALPQLPPRLTQGQKNADDSTLRIGLIVRGNKKLNWFQRKIAPRWLLELEKLTPQNHGISHVQFISTCQQKKLLNKQRTHYLDSNLKEECVTWLEKVGPFNMSKKWNQPMPVLGVWIATDGDDTQSSFELRIDSIQISHK